MTRRPAARRRTTIDRQTLICQICAEPTRHDLEVSYRAGLLATLLPLRPDRRWYLIREDCGYRTAYLPRPRTQPTPPTT